MLLLLLHDKKFFLCFLLNWEKMRNYLFCFFLFSFFSFFHNHKTFFPFSLNISTFSSFAFSFYKHLHSPLGSPYLTLPFALSPSLSFTMFLISSLLFFFNFGAAAVFRRRKKSSNEKRPVMFWTKLRISFRTQWRKLG